jgi:hypothetical protein
MKTSTLNTSKKMDIITDSYIKRFLSNTRYIELYSKVNTDESNTGYTESYSKVNTDEPNIHELESLIRQYIKNSKRMLKSSCSEESNKIIFNAIKHIPRKSGSLKSRFSKLKHFKNYNF